MAADPLADLELAAKDLLAAEYLTPDELVRAGGLLSLLDAAFARHARLLDLLGTAEFEGYGSARSWLAATTRMSPAAAGRHLRRGRYAHHHDRSATVWQAGEITGEHIDALEHVWRHAHDDTAYLEYEPVLIELARHATPTDVAGVGRAWLAHLEAERESAAARRDDERRAEEEAALAADLRNPDCPAVADPADRYAANRSDANPYDDLLTDPSTLGFTDPVAGFAVPYGHLRTADLAEILHACNTQIERDHTEGDRRPRSERLAQALVEICRQYNSQQINEGRNTPHIVISADAAVYTGTRIGPIRTTNGLLLTRDELHRLTCQSIVTILQTGTRGQLDLARTRRDFTRDQRRALEHRDGPTCAFPNCAAAADRCEAHHITWWELNGLTNLDNGILLCGFHHRLVHEGQWTIETRPHGHRFWKPDRHEYRDHTRRPPPCTPTPTPSPRQ